jgi:hypothetical protein
MTRTRFRYRRTAGGLIVPGNATPGVESDAAPTGLGVVGGGAANGGPNPDETCCFQDPMVWRLIQAGSSRLALARATGVPIVPLSVNVRGTFADTSTTDVPTVGMEGNQGGVPYRIVQDALCDCMIARIQNLSTTSGDSTFASLSDFFNNFQSNIEATLTVEGQPRYQIASYFTPISTLMDVINGASHWPFGWILKPSEQLLMSFHAQTPLPTAPIEVVCTFRIWTTVSDGNVPTNLEAFEQLCELGYEVPDAVVNNLCR